VLALALVSRARFADAVWPAPKREGDPRRRVQLRRLLGWRTRLRGHAPASRRARAKARRMAAICIPSKPRGLGQEYKLTSQF